MSIGQAILICTCVAAESVLCGPAMAQAVPAFDREIIRRWAQERVLCREGPDDYLTWISCGMQDAFAEVLVARRFCLDGRNQDWRIGEASVWMGNSDCILEPTSFSGQ